jgi:hypothetical protein
MSSKTCFTRLKTDIHLHISRRTSVPELWNDDPAQRFLNTLRNDEATLKKFLPMKLGFIRQNVWVLKTREHGVQENEINKEENRTTNFEELLEGGSFPQDESAHHSTRDTWDAPRELIVW